MAGEVISPLLRAKRSNPSLKPGSMDCFVAALFAMTKELPRHSGATRSGEPGIHNHDREYGFRVCAYRRIPD
jgi:hypothetical protein